MKILVTGCAGMIGSRVCAHLLTSGHSVVGLDIMGGYDLPLKEWRLAELLKQKLSENQGDNQFTFIKSDIANRDDVARTFDTQGGGRTPFDGVINLAARAGVRPSLKFPQDYYDTNLSGTLNLLQVVRDSGVGKFVLASTSSVYGDGKQPFHEDSPADRPMSPYAASKKAAENLCYSFHHAYGIDVTVLRYFTVYGPAGRPDMAILRFIKWIAEGEPLNVFGDGSQERDFTYVDDIARGTALALKPLGFEVINLGSDRPVAVRDVIKMAENLLEKEAQIQNLPPNRADVPSTWADVSKAERLLGWRPQTMLEEGLSRTVSWYMENRELAKKMCELSD